MGVQKTMGVKKALFPRFVLNDATPELLWQAGANFGTQVKQKSLIVQAVENSSVPPELVQMFNRGLVDRPVGLISIGQSPVQGLAYTMVSIKAYAGVLISGDNTETRKLSISVMTPQGFLSEEQIENVLDLGVLRKSVTENQGVRVQLDYKDGYASFLSFTVKKDLQRTVIWDDSAYLNKTLLRKITSRLSGVHILLSSESGQGPRRTSDERMRSMIRKHKADVGFVLDNTGSQLTVYSETGRILPRHEVFICLIHDLPPFVRGQNSIVMCDLSMPDCVFTEIRRKGYVPRIVSSDVVKMRHAFYRHPVELVSHPMGYCFSSLNHSVADVLYGAVRLLRFLSSIPMSVGEWLEKTVPRLHRYEVILSIGQGNLDDLYNRLEGVLRFHKQVYTRLDGVRVSHERGGWFISPYTHGIDPISMERIRLVMYGLFPHDIVNIRSRIETYLEEAGITMTVPNKARQN